ncbi:uncharacterized protein LOC106164610 [Lingula anatina]|uniref:Uncharacterized protein LOC106164610 n=1 Tax=Lingula anatina TaxID=7574 RepID=A0A1S3IIG5_LINAN|nr:uncharacterized protein LOC106164610 [Lingula anatina]|eukprot:XP_013398030.1 uncharacterized protein LOC106164610 [Lingula anatina]
MQPVCGMFIWVLISCIATVLASDPQVCLERRNYAKQEGGVPVIGTHGSLEECQDFCLRDVNCAAVSYHRVTQTCEKYNALRNAEDVKNDTCCYHFRKVPCLSQQEGSDSKVTSGVNNSGDVTEMRNAPNGTAFTKNPDRSRSDEYEKMFGQNETSVTEIPFTSPTTFYLNTIKPTTDVSVAKMTTTEETDDIDRMETASNEISKQTTPATRTPLHSERGKSKPKDADVFTTTKVVPTDTTEDSEQIDCLQQYYDAKQNGGYQVKSLSKMECQAVCLLQADCKAMDFNRVTKECTLHLWSSETSHTRDKCCQHFKKTKCKLELPEDIRERFKSEKGVSTTQLPKTCTRRVQAMRTYFGSSQLNGLKQIGTFTAAQCKAECMRKSACAASDFDSFQNVCFLHSRTDPYMHTTNPCCTHYKKVEECESACFQTHLDITHPGGDLVANQTEFSCREECIKIGECAAFTYNYTDSTCRIHKELDYNRTARTVDSCCSHAKKGICLDKDPDLAVTTTTTTTTVPGMTTTTIENLWDIFNIDGDTNEKGETANEPKKAGSLEMTETTIIILLGCLAVFLIAIGVVVVFFCHRRRQQKKKKKSKSSVTNPTDPSTWMKDYTLQTAKTDAFWKAISPPGSVTKRSDEGGVRRIERHKSDITQRSDYGLVQQNPYYGTTRSVPGRRASENPYANYTGERMRYAAGHMRSSHYAETSLYDGHPHSPPSVDYPVSEPFDPSEHRYVGRHDFMGRPLSLSVDELHVQQHPSERSRSLKIPRPHVNGDHPSVHQNEARPFDGPEEKKLGGALAYANDFADSERYTRRVSPM